MTLGPVGRDAGFQEEGTRGQWLPEGWRLEALLCPSLGERGCGVQSPETVVWLLRGGQGRTSQPTLFLLRKICSSRPPGLADINISAALQAPPLLGTEKLPQALRSAMLSASWRRQPGRLQKQLDKLFLLVLTTASQLPPGALQQVYQGGWAGATYPTAGKPLYPPLWASWQGRLQPASGISTVLRAPPAREPHAVVTALC